MGDFMTRMPRRLERHSARVVLLFVSLAVAGSLALSEMRTLAVGSDEIPFRKHTIDLGSSESCAVADVNRDGRLDIVSAENWYEQASPSAGGKDVRWIRHKFRELGYNSFYIENLIDIPVDVNGDGFPDIVSASYWSKPFTWWENPASQTKTWRESIIESGSPVEFVFLVDLLGTGKPLQLLPQFTQDSAVSGSQWPLTSPVRAVTAPPRVACAEQKGRHVGEGFRGIPERRIASCRPARPHETRQRRGPH